MSSEKLDLTTQSDEVKSYSGDEIKKFFEKIFRIGWEWQVINYLNLSMNCYPEQKFTDTTPVNL